MGMVVMFHALTGKRSGRKAETGIPVRSETVGTSLPSILRAPVSQRVTVGRETPRASANSSCEIPRVFRYSVRAESAFMPPSVPNWHSSCQAQSVGLVRDMITGMTYCTGMVTTGRSLEYLWIDERMNALGIDDAELGRRCGVDRVTALRWRDPAEQHRINPRKMALIAKALECSAVDLFLPPGQVMIAVDVAGKLAEKRSHHEKPVDGPSVRQPRRMRQ